MLLQFGVENFRSFRDRAELSMVSTRFKDEPQHRFDAPGVDHGVLPVMALFGANASGKSNLLAAFETMRDEVTNSFDRKPDARMGFHPFRLGDSDALGVTTFDIDFLLDGVRYTYGFRYDAQQVHEEWLYAFPDSYRQVWFHRNTAEDEPFYFGPSLKGRKQIIAELTRPNSLLLSTAAQHNQKQLSPIYSWFSRDVAIVDGLMGRGFPTFHANSVLLAPHRRAVVTELLRLADLGVTNFKVRDLPGPEPSFVESLPEEERGELMEKLSDQKSVELGHRTKSGKTRFLPSSDESHGTQMLLFHSNSVLSALEAGQLLIIDELDASLHPRLSAALIRMFTDPDANPNGAQLVFTTHDESLFQHVRRDSVVFTEKDGGGASRLVPLAEFKTRERDDIGRAYAQGRFGGTPITGDLAGAIARHQSQ